MRSLKLKLENTIKLFDIYGQKVQLNLNKKQNYNTVFGGIFSLFVFGLLLTGCWFFGKELFYKQNPQVISQERVVDCPKRIDVKPDNLIIMMGVSNGSTQSFSDPTIFTVNAIQQQQVRYVDQNTGLSTIKLVDQSIKIRFCNENDIGMTDTKNYFKQLNYPLLYCFDTSEEQPVYFEGDFNQTEFSQLIVYFEKCQNSTSSQIICKPKEVIDKVLLLTKVGVFMSDHVINPLNFKNPISNRGISLYASTSSTFPQEMSLYFTNQYIETDSGVFYQQLETLDTFVFVQQTITPYFSSPNTLARVVIRLQKQKENYMKRTYLKLADVVAQIGGLLKILVLFGYLLSNRISKLYYFKAIIDEVYQFESSNESSTHNILRYSFSNFLTYAFTNKSKVLSDQNQLLNQGIEKIQENFDILYIFNKLFEIDKIKQILFNSDQLKLFEYMPKPVISKQTILNEKQEMENLKNKEMANNQNSHLSSSPVKKSQEKNKNISNKDSKTASNNTNQNKNRKIKSERQLSEEALESFKNILQQNNISKIDQNLIKIIDPSILQELNKSKQNFCLNSSEDNDSTFFQMKSNSKIIQKSFASYKKSQGHQQMFENKQKGNNKISQNGFQQQDQVIDPYFSQTQEKYTKVNKDISKTETECKQVDEGDLFEDNFVYFVEQDDITQQANIQSLYFSAVKQSENTAKQKKK
ncbi:hypothetical protein ABPG72_005425 [Tetrahymena utriculariae]